MEKEEWRISQNPGRGVLFYVLFGRDGLCFSPCDFCRILLIPFYLFEALKIRRFTSFFLRVKYRRRHLFFHVCFITTFLAGKKFLRILSLGVF